MRLCALLIFALQPLGAQPQGGLYQDILNQALAGDAAAQTKLGDLFRLGKGGADKDPAKAVKWYRQAAQQGDAEAICILGEMASLGAGMPINPVEAFECFSRAAELGHPRAQSNLGCLYREGKGVVKNDVEAAKWALRSAELGYAPAQNDIALMYASGQGIGKDDEAAASWFRKAADAGVANAQFMMGVAHEKGYGVTKSPEDALRWYAKAAAQKDARAEFNLGKMYYSGQGTVKDERLAFEWLKKAADHQLPEAKNMIASFKKKVDQLQSAASKGDPDATTTLAAMYWSGVGVSKNTATSIKLYEKAATKGGLAAVKALEAIHSPASPSLPSDPVETTESVLPTQQKTVLMPTAPPVIIAKISQSTEAEIEQKIRARKQQYIRDLEKLTARLTDSRNIEQALMVVTEKEAYENKQETLGFDPSDRKVPADLQQLRASFDSDMVVFKNELSKIHFAACSTQQAEPASVASSATEQTSALQSPAVAETQDFPLPPGAESPVAAQPESQAAADPIKAPTPVTPVEPTPVTTPTIFAQQPPPAVEKREIHPSPFDIRSESSEVRNFDLVTADTPSQQSASPQTGGEQPAAATGYAPKPAPAKAASSQMEEFLLDGPLSQYDNGNPVGVVYFYSDGRVSYQFGSCGRGVGSWKAINPFTVLLSLDDGAWVFRMRYDSSKRIFKGSIDSTSKRRDSIQRIYKRDT